MELKETAGAAGYLSLEVCKAPGSSEVPGALV